MRCVTFFLLLVLSIYVQAYKAGVVHYYPSSGKTPTKTIHKNLKEYEKHATNAAKKGVDILVFPEYGLVTLDALDEPEEYSIEVSFENPVVNQLGTIARTNSLYLVVNVFEKIGDEYYNTDLVFDRNGTMVHKYHKMHMFNENKLSPGLPNQTTTFDTDFGVTFGIFTCFDIFFVNPSQTTLSRRDGGTITDVVFVTAWVPSNNALNIQHGYSVANRVNLLAANYASPDSGDGTGIYLIDGGRSMVENSSKSRLITRDVPFRKPEGKSCTNKVTKLEKTQFQKVTQTKVSTSSKHKFHPIDLTQKYTSTQICKEVFCCTLDLIVDTTTPNTDDYKLVIFSDSAYRSDLKTDLQMCGLVACLDDSEDSCGEVSNATARFLKISLRGGFRKDSSLFFRPVTVDTSGSPLKRIYYCEFHSESESFVQVKSENQKGIRFFGLFQRRDTVFSGSIEDLRSGFYDSPSVIRDIFW